MIRARRLRMVVVGVLIPTGCGDVAPPPQPVTYRAVELSSGAVVHLSDLEGRPVLLASWATWCAPCRAELPKLQALHEARRRDGLVVVAVNVDSPGAAADAIDAMVREFELSMPLWRDADDSFTHVFRGFGVPMSVLVSRDGERLQTWHGTLRTSDPEVTRALDAALAEPGD